MPASVLPQATARAVTKQRDTQKARASAPAKKRRVVRRRGRARGELDSDDEIEREAHTDDSDSENNLSSASSATDDSDTEPASEDVIPHDRTHLPTPRNSKSPESVAKADPTSFFAPSGSWSEMVADEGANGPAELPVVDFADFGTRPVPSTITPSRKNKKSNKNSRPTTESLPPPAAPVSQEDPPPAPDDDQNAASTDSKRIPAHQRQPLPGNSARLLYQQKLETDPSFVPTIGNFWGHDDRLIDTELRSLSGWWRGRGGRGRGRGGFGMRGRGGFNGFPPEREPLPSKDEEVPPVERAWTHDGFEELKKKDDQRRAEQAAARQVQSSPKRGAFVGRGGRGGFVPNRGRGGFLRGGFASPVRPRNNLPFAPGNRVRFVMKPELMWTKQHEAFLYFDSTLKPRLGQGAGFRLKLPGRELHVIRAPPISHPTPEASSSKVAPPKVDKDDNYFVVRLPRRAGKEKEVLAVATVARSGEIDGIVEEVLSIKPVEMLEQPPAAVQASGATVVSQLENLSLESTVLDPERQALTEHAVLRQSTDPTDEVQDSEVSPSVERPTLHPLQTTFTPPPPVPQSQASPAYGSPYGYPVSLPPGIAMNPHGMPYELSTGRPVYLQPPTMYNPRPMVHSHFHPGVPFHPGHMHHPSLSTASPDFLAQPPSHTPPVNGFIDPATGTPIFSFPRQTSRIQIRAPTGGVSEPSKVTTSKVSMSHTPSGLRTTAPTFQPSQSNGTPSEGSYYQHSATPSDSTLPSYEIHPQEHGAIEEGVAVGGMVHYPQHYQQQYYYPEMYGYPQYMDVSHAGQTYDVYGMEQVPQGTIYY